MEPLKEEVVVLVSGLPILHVLFHDFVVQNVTLIFVINVKMATFRMKINVAIIL